MNPTRKRRMYFLIGVIAAACVAAGLIAYTLQQNATFLFTPSEIKAGATKDAERFRLGGMVAKGSFKRAEGSMESHFAVTDGDAQMPVVYTGILPDLFREDQAVIATGKMQGDTFVAEQVLAKHDENYMPKEVADKMGKAHVKHDVPVPPTGTPAQ